MYDGSGGTFYSRRSLWSAVVHKSIFRGDSAISEKNLCGFWALFGRVSKICPGQVELSASYNMSVVRSFACANKGYAISPCLSIGLATKL